MPRSLGRSFVDFLQVGHVSLLAVLVFLLESDEAEDSLGSIDEEDLVSEGVLAVGLPVERYAGYV